jgi:hypothetical protein
MMEQETNASTPFLLIQKPQEMIKLFEGLIDQKIKEIGSLNQMITPVIPADGSPFLSSKEVQQIFNVSRQTINDWRKSDLLQSFKIKSRRYFFKDQVEQLKHRWVNQEPVT